MKTIEKAVMLVLLVVMIFMMNQYVVTGTDTGSTIWRNVSYPMVGAIGAIGLVILIIRGVMSGGNQYE